MTLIEQLAAIISKSNDDFANDEQTKLRVARAVDIISAALFKVSKQGKRQATLRLETMTSIRRGIYENFATFERTELGNVMLQPDDPQRHPLIDHRLFPLVKYALGDGITVTCSPRNAGSYPAQLLVFF